MKNLLKGKKTYLVSLLSILVAIVGYVNNRTYGQILPYLFAGAFGGSLRAAIAKLEAGLLNQLPKPVGTLVKPELDAAIAKAEG